MAASKKSLRTQIDEVMAAISKLAEEEKPAPAKCNLRMTQLETLRYLHQQEVAEEKDKLVAENESLRKRIAELESSPSAPTQADPLDDVVRQMLHRHQHPVVATSIQAPVPVAPVTIPARSATEDADLLI
jgi:hypothetical protein